VVEGNEEGGLLVAGSDFVMEGSIVRGTVPRASDQTAGRGIEVMSCGIPNGCASYVRSRAEIRGSLVEQNYEMGLYISNSDATVESTVVRGTSPQAVDQRLGRGIDIQVSCTPQKGCDASARANATVRSSLVEQNHDVGLFVGGSDAVVETTVIRDTLPQASDMKDGRGMDIELACLGALCNPMARANATVRGALIDRNHDVGLFVAGSDATVETTVVRGTAARASDGFMGDGVSFVYEDAPVSGTVTSSSIIDNNRAGLACFGGQVALAGSWISCNAFDLEGEVGSDQPFVFEDRGRNFCGCPEPTKACSAVSAGLEPPAPIK